MTKRTVIPFARFKTSDVSVFIDYDTTLGFYNCQVRIDGKLVDNSYTTDSLREILDYGAMLIFKYVKPPEGGKVK